MAALSIVKVTTLPETLEPDTVYIVKTTIGGDSNKIQLVVTDEDGIPYSTPNETDILNVITQQP